jgi:hypothetical protein
LLIALLIYVVTIMNGSIKPDQRLSIVDLVVLVVGIIIVAVIVAPQVLDRIQTINVGDLKLELREIRYHQQLQREELDRIRLALRLALTEDERKRLVNLAQQPDAAVKYRGSQVLRIEQRHLRALELISRKRAYADIPDGREFDLREFADLTETGRDYLRSISD